MTDPIVIYPARRVVTMDPARPVAEAVAVRGDRIVAAGTLAELAQFEGTTVDDRYADDVLFPGFVEAHAHASSAASWRNTYVGYYDRTDLSGRVWAGCTTLEAVLERLRESEEAMPEGEVPLVAWGLDPIFFPGDRLLGKHLDLVSTTRPVYVQHANGHLATVNTALMRTDGITAATTVDGVARDDDGVPNGELREFAAMNLAVSAREHQITVIDEEALLWYSIEACNTGTTTSVDLASPVVMTDAGMAMYRSAAENPDFSMRLAPFHWGIVPVPGKSLDEVAEALVELRATSTPKLKLGYVKLILDGSIQGFTARLGAPGYLGREENGMWIVSPEEFERSFTAYHRAGLHIHVHCNGDEATELMLDTVERILVEHPRPDHRHTVTHSQLSTAAQYRRMKALGLCANIFSNHLWYWGDQHMDVTVGVDRAHRMNAAATALREGVPISLHSDSPVTPLGPLSTASYAAERRTSSGRSMGDAERISVHEALYAMTLGAAYQLKLDSDVGSIEGGKYADFAVLDRDPTEVADPAELRAVTVRGTVVGGEHHAANRTS